MNAARASPDAQDVPFLVIGSGPAGQKAAIQAAKAGREVWLVEREAAAGGACVRTGTIPSKTLRERALRPRLHGDPDPIERPMGELLEGVGEVVAAHDRYWGAQLERNGVHLLRGQARFVGPREVEVVGIAGATLRLRAARIVIATGSRPRAPSHLAIDHEHVLDSDSILSLAWLPRSLLVLGGGVIASEYASIFASLGCRVHQADRNARPLAFVDAELTDLYLEALRAAGGEFLSQHGVRRLAWDGTSQVEAEFEGGRRLVTDKVLVALGRVANVEDLQLEATGVTLNASGHVEVDDQLETRASGIYAAGDVIGPPALASAAMEQGRRAACHALGLLAPAELDATIPAGIYSIPEISTVGLDEAAARARHGEVLVGRAHFAEIARGQISGRPRGLLKMVATADGREVVGIQVAGDGATELVHVGQMGMMAGLGVDAFVDTIFNFPTLAEAYRVAALDIVRQRRGAGARTAVAAGLRRHGAAVDASPRATADATATVAASATG